MTNMVKAQAVNLEWPREMLRRSLIKGTKKARESMLVKLLSYIMLVHSVTESGQSKKKH